MEKIKPQSIVTSSHSPQPSVSTPSPSVPSSQTKNKTEEETEEVKKEYKASKGTFSKESVHMTCPHCHADIHTLVMESESCEMPLWVGLPITLICCCFCTCPFACYVSFCPDICCPDVQKHYCPECDSYLGTS